MTSRRDCTAMCAGALFGLFVLQASPPVRAQTPAPAQAAPIASTPGPVFNLTVDREDVVVLLKRVATEAGISMAFVGDVKGTVTLALRNASVDDAVSLMTAAAGLSVHKQGGSYLISTGTGPQPRAEAIYRVQHVRGDRLVEALKGLYPADQLRVQLGPDEYHSPKLDASSSSGNASAPAAAPNPYNLGAALTANVSGSGSGGAASAAAPIGARQILLVGEAPAVTRALELCRAMDHSRRQVRISVKVTDIDTAALREFGIKWSWSRDLKFTEQLQSGTEAAEQKLRSAFSIGKFLRNPLFLDAAIVALEQQGRSTLLATPSLSILDGERGFIMIGDKHLYPRLTGFSSSGTPIFETTELNVGIQLRVAVEVNDSQDILLTLYPQVSAITGYLETEFGSYPRVSTREQQTTIRARAGETIVIGGLMKEGAIDNSTGIPGLSRIPGLGELFKSRKKQGVTTELVMMLIPEIVEGTEPDRTEETPERQFVSGPKPPPTSR